MMKKSILIVYFFLSFINSYSQEKELNNFLSVSIGGGMFSKPFLKPFGLLPATSIAYTHFFKYKNNLSFEYNSSVKPLFYSYYTDYLNSNQLLFFIGQSYTFKKQLFINLSIGLGTMLIFDGIYNSTNNTFSNGLTYVLNFSTKFEFNYFFKNNTLLGFKYIFGNNIYWNNDNHNFLINFGVRF